MLLLMRCDFPFCTMLTRAWAKSREEAWQKWVCGPLCSILSMRPAFYTPVGDKCWPGRVVQYCRVDSIGQRDRTIRSIRRMENFYWRSDKWSCRLENCISLEGLKKYFTLISWHSPRLTLSIWSIRRMVNFYWRSDKWSCRSENCISLAGLVA